MPLPLLTLSSLCLAEVAQVIFFVLWAVEGDKRQQGWANLVQGSHGR